MDKFKMAKHLQRTNSICPGPEERLLTALKTSNVHEIENLVQSNRSLLGHIYDDLECHPILLVACDDFVETTTPQAVETLINLGANVNHSQKSDAGWTALHFAVCHNKLEIVRTILKLQPDAIKDLAEGDTILHTLVKYAIPKFSDQDLAKCTKVIVQHGVDVNYVNSQGENALFLAAESSYKATVTAILDNTNYVNLNYEQNGETIKSLIEKNNLYDQHKLAKFTSISATSKKENLFRLLNLNNEEGFVQAEIDCDSVNATENDQTLLQRACSKGFIKATQLLLKLDADPFKAPKGSKTPIEITSDYGHFTIFKDLLNYYIINEKTVPDGVLISLTQYCDKQGVKECFEYLIEKALEVSKINNFNLININANNSVDHNTCLHYAIRYASETTTRQLLCFGASLAAKNKIGYMPIQDISSTLLEQHLDDCITFEQKDSLEKPHCKISIKFDSLITNTPKETNMLEDIKIDDNNKNTISLEEMPLSSKQDSTIHPESDVIFYLCKSKELRHLLAHPVIVTFLLLKWHKIRWLFRVNIFFYTLFLLSLIVYILSDFANFHPAKESIHSLAIVSKTILLITFIILIIREFFQLTVSPLSYFKNLENYIEIALIITTLLVFLLPDPSRETRKELSSLSILLASFVFILLVGHHPSLFTNVEILRKVLYNFFKLLLWYSVLILAFVLSFYIMFTDPDEEKKAEDEHTISFHNPGQSFFKTIIMLTGEFDASSIKFDTVLSKVIFGLFIFMITIILLNLLNGMAVSDINVIKNDAKLVGLVARAKFVSYTEDMIIGNKLLPKSFVESIYNLFCCLPKCYFNISKPLTKYCLLEKNLESGHYVVDILINDGGRISAPQNQTKLLSNCHRFWSLSLDKDTTEAIKSILKRKSVKSKSNCPNCIKILEMLSNENKEIL